MSFTLQDYENQDEARRQSLIKTKAILENNLTVDDVAWCAGAIEQLKYRCQHLTEYFDAVNALAVAAAAVSVLTGEQARIIARSTVFTDIPNGQELRWETQYKDGFSGISVVCGMRTFESFGNFIPT